MTNLLDKLPKGVKDFNFIPKMIEFSPAVEFDVAAVKIFHASR